MPNVGGTTVSPYFNYHFVSMRSRVEGCTIIISSVEETPVMYKYTRPLKIPWASLFSAN